jgi:hypothetical protein
MLIIDDLLTSPLRGLFWIFKEIHNAAQEELAGSADAITRELSEIYLELESGKITESEFDAREKVLLDRLDLVQGTA